MTYFLNVFKKEFIGPLNLGDRQYTMNFNVKANAGRGDDIVQSFGEPNFNLSGNDSEGNPSSTLTIKYSKDQLGWNALPIVVSVSSTANPADIVIALNANATFAGMFEATVEKFSKNGKDRVTITLKTAHAERVRFYIERGGAEEKLQFNYLAGVAELPTYFARHIIDSQIPFPNSESPKLLIELDPSNDVDAAVIDNARDGSGKLLKLDSGTVREDWQLLNGHSGLFIFKVYSYDGSNRVEELLEYHAGAKEGDLAKKTLYSYTAAAVVPDYAAEIPYTLTNSDLITP